MIRNLNKLERIPDELRESIFEKLFSVAEIAKFSLDEVKEYEDSLKTYRDLKNSIDTAREEGREEGRLEGREEGREEGKEEGIELVLRVISFYRQGKDVKEIAELVGINEERVIDILKKINNNE